MKSLLIKGVGIISATLISISANLAQARTLDETTMFVGTDFEWINLKGKSDWGKVLPKFYPGVNFYVGTRFFEYLGLELGYTFTGTETRAQTFSAGDTFFGTAVGGAATKFKVGLSGWHLDLLGYLPILNCSDLIVALGYGSIKPKVTETIRNNKWDGLHQGVARLGVGAQYRVTQYVSVRGLIRWMNTSRLKVTNLNPTVPIKAFNDTYGLAVGVFFNF